MKPGIYEMDAKTYHALPLEIVSNSYLSRLNKTPAHARLKQEETPTLVFGRAVHSYILEGPQAFFKEFAVAPGIDKRNKEGRQIWADYILANEEGEP